MKEATEFLVDSCKFEVKKEKNTFTIAVKGEACQTGEILKQMVDHIFPNNQLTKETGNFLSVGSSIQVVIDTDAHTVEFVAQAKDRVVIIKDLLTVSESSFRVKTSYTVGDENIIWEQLEVEIKGKLKIKEITVDAVLLKKKGAKSLSLKASIAKLSIKDLLAKGPKDTADIFGLVDSNNEAVKKILEFSIKDITLDVEFDPTTIAIDVVFAGSVDGDKVIKQARFFIVIDKLPNDPIKTAVVGDLQAINIAELLTKLSGKDLTKIPLLNSNVDVLLQIASDNIAVVKNEGLAAALKKYPSQGPALSKGLLLNFNLNVGGTEGAKSVNLPLRISKDMLDFQFTPSLELSLKAALEKLGNPDLKIPGWLVSETPLSIALKQLKISFADGSVLLDAFAAGPIKIGKILQVANVQFKISRKATDSAWDFTFEAEFHILEKVQVQMSLINKGKDYEIKGKMGRIKINEFLAYLSVKSDNKILDAVIDNLEINLSLPGADTKGVGFLLR